jgi:hypothetical protein
MGYMGLSTRTSGRFHDAAEANDADNGKDADFQLVVPERNAIIFLQVK